MSTLSVLLHFFGTRKLSIVQSGSKLLSSNSKTRAILGAFVPTLFTTTESRIAQAKLHRNLPCSHPYLYHRLARIECIQVPDQSASCCIGYAQQCLATHSNIDISRSCYQDTLAGPQNIQNTTKKVYGKYTRSVQISILTKCISHKPFVVVF